MAERKSVFITGGSRGIGAACVRRFACEGWNVAFTYASNEKAKDSLLEELGESEGQVLALRLAFGPDTGFDEMERIHREARTYLGIPAFDCYIGNAGISVSGELARMSPDAISEVLRINLESQILMTKVVTESMILEKMGSVILISSMWGLRGASCESVYSASKAGLIGFGKSMALELATSGIRVNMIAPGVIDTDMNRTYSDDELADIRMKIPLGRLGSPDEVSNYAWFLASDEAEFVTGEVARLDGGITV